MVKPPARSSGAARGVLVTRDKHERAQDRADLLEVLAEADRTGQAPLRTDTLIARANGMHDPALTDTSWWRHYSRGMSDLRALERQGRILGGCATRCRGGRGGGWPPTRTSTPNRMRLR